MIKNIILSVFAFILFYPLLAQDITLGTLLVEMISREQLAIHPGDQYTTEQFSSYDRRSVVPGGENWFANQDNTNFIRREMTENGEEWVMLDAQAPGAVVRWWMTFSGKAGEGIIRIYIDGQEKPVIEGSAYEVVSGGKIVGAPLSTSVSELTPYDKRGHNLYLPIPYGKSCKITYQNEGIISTDKGEIIDKDAAIYYIINYRKYDPQIRVESFNNTSLEKYAPELSKAQLSLAMPFSQILTEKPQKSLKMRKLAPNDKMELEFSGEAYIKALSMKLDAGNLSQALRSTILSLSFDDQKTLTVPVGEFFGTGYEMNPYETYFTKVFNTGLMLSAWPMPFRSTAKITITNLGDEPVRVLDLNGYMAPWKWDEQSMYFGGSWKQWYEKPTGGADNPEDLNFTSLKGQGVYVGDLVTIYNNMAAWWGEGDEKIYVDGEDFPSHFGTGSEDYYGYAWSGPAAFSHPFIAQPDGSGNLNKGTAVNIRFRALDKIPFQESLKMDMELWHWAKTTVNYASSTFFYLMPGGKTLTEFDENEAARPVKRKVKEETITPNSEMVDGKIQGENLEAIRIDAGMLGPQRWAKPIWDKDQQLWWRQNGLGDELHLEFTSDQSYSNRDVEFQLTKAVDYGVAVITLNEGTPITFDAYAPTVSVERVVMKKGIINKGANYLKIKIIGKNEQALPGYFFGIDYLEVSNDSK